jgi:phenylalanyl-tRNA synthetase beta chain
MAVEGEELHGLNGSEYKLGPEDVVVADSEAALSLAGILGGEPSAVNDGTTSVLLESATWEPVSLRLQTKRNAVRTDASNRFEKSRSPIAAPIATYRYLELLLQEIPGVRFSQLVDCYPEKQEPMQIKFGCDYIRERLGLEVSDDKIRHILTALGFQFSGNGAQLTVDVPFERATRDISMPDDLVEEVGRIIGYGEVPEQAPLISCDTQKRIPIIDFEHEFRDFLRAAGFNEVYLYSFFNEAAAKGLGIDVSRTVKLENPIDSQLDVMRTSLVPGMIECVRGNQRYNKSVAIFEVGRTATDRPKKKGDVRDTGSDEGRRLGLAYVVESSVKNSSTIHQQLKAESFYAVARVVERMLWGVARVQAKLVAPSEGNSGIASWMHPYRSAQIICDGVSVGVIAEINPAVVSDITGRLVLVEIDLLKLLELRRAVEEFKPLRRFPDSFFEISVISEDVVPYAELEGFIRKSKTAVQLQRIELLDVYKGEPLKPGEKSTSIKLSFGNPDSTLSADDVKAIREGIVAELKGSKFVLRSA